MRIAPAFVTIWSNPVFEKLMSSFRRAPKTAPEPDSTNLIDPENIGDFARVSITRLAHQDACRLHNGGVLLLNPDDVKSAFSNKTFSNEPSRFSAIAPRNSEKYVATQVATNIPRFKMPHDMALCANGCPNLFSPR